MNGLIELSSANQDLLIRLSLKNRGILHLVRYRTMPILLRLQRLRISATNTIVVFVVCTISLFPPPAVPVFGTTPGDRYKNSVGGQV
jgi:hypothetical protein